MKTRRYHYRDHDKSETEGNDSSSDHTYALFEVVGDETRRSEDFKSTVFDFDINN